MGALTEGSCEGAWGGAVEGRVRLVILAVAPRLTGVMVCVRTFSSSESESSIVMMIGSADLMRGVVAS